MKPGALRNGAPVMNWELPPALAKLRRRLGSGDEADRRFVRVLSLVLTDGLDLVEAAVRDALEDGTACDDVIVNIIGHRRREADPAEEVPTSPALTLVHAPVADCARYDLLRGARASWP